MSVTPRDFFEFAQRIANGATGEIDRRNAISRVYYAAYHTGIAQIRGSSGFNELVDIELGHAAFCQQLLNAPKDSPLRRLGVAMNYLRQSRNNADYGLLRSISKGDVTTAFGAYKNVLVLLERASPALRI